MRSLGNFNFASLTTFETSKNEIRNQISYLIEVVSECDSTFTSSDREQLVRNIQWLKRFYESAERNLLDGK